MVYLADYERRTLHTAMLEQLKSRLRALYEAGHGAKTDTAAECMNDSDADDEDETAALGGRIPIPAETFLEALSQKLEIHPIPVYWLLKEMREQEGLVSPPELKREIEDYVSVTVLRLLGYCWPEQDAYEREHGPIMDPSLVDEDGIIPLVPCGDELTYRIRCCWKDEAEIGRPGPYAPVIDDGVTVNIRPLQEAGLLAVREVIKKW